MKTNKVIIIIVVFIGLGIAGLSGFLFLNKGNQSNTELNQTINNADIDTESSLKAVDDLEKEMSDINQSDFE